MPKAMIVGVGELPSEKCSQDFPANLRSLQLHEEAILKALSDAGLHEAEVDGLITCGSFVKSDFMHAHTIAEKIGFEALKVCDVVDQGGASPVSAVLLAKRYVEAGAAENIVVVAADSVGTLCYKEKEVFKKKVWEAMGTPAGTTLDDPVLIEIYNEVTKVYCNKYGVSRKELAIVPVMASEHAALHPGALCKKPLTHEEILNSPQIAPHITHINFLECARPADGGAAAVVSCDKERWSNGIDILGGGEVHHHKTKIDFSDFPKHLTAKEAFDAAFAEAGIDEHKVNILWLYNCFPIVVIMALEDAGLSFRGQGCQSLSLIRWGHHFVGKKLCPITTNGGLTGHGAPWQVPGMLGFTEVVIQLRGQAGERQIADANVGLVYNQGGVFSSHSVVILAN